MKKEVAILLTLVCLSTTIFAEGNFGGKAQFGYPIYAGVEDYLPDAQQDFSYNSNISAFFEFIVNDYFGIQLEAGITMKNIDYISFYPDSWEMLYFPIYAKCKIPTDFTEYYFMAGPSMHVVLEGPYMFFGDPYKEIHNDVLFGYSFEGGVSLPLFPGGDSFVFGIHYNAHFNKPYSDLNLDIIDFDLVLAYSANTRDFTTTHGFGRNLQ